MKEEEINILADEKGKNQVFSFELIKPSLVFFNLDGGSLSIISNNDKNDKEYKDLKELWNSQNFDVNKKEELINYKDMQHDKFVSQIKILFSIFWPFFFIFIRIIFFNFTNSNTDRRIRKGKQR